MPARNTLKVYEENGYYHVYNRGVEKRDIFLDGQDYLVFLAYLKSYLINPKSNLLKTYPTKKLRNFFEQIDLLCYCLMPNHFHLLIKQNTKTAITEFLRSLLTRYSMYFNRKYNRVGSLFQGRYKAVLIKTEEQLLYLSHYIHRNPTAGSVLEVERYRYSSLENYLGKINQSWVNTSIILDYFSESNLNLSYRSFVFDSEIVPTAGSVLEVE